jgi:hypothetical protein
MAVEIEFHSVGNCIKYAWNGHVFLHQPVSHSKSTYGAGMRRGTPDGKLDSLDSLDSLFLSRIIGAARPQSFRSKPRNKEQHCITRTGESS